MRTRHALQEEQASRTHASDAIATACVHQEHHGAAAASSLAEGLVAGCHRAVLKRLVTWVDFLRNRLWSLRDARSTTQAYVRGRWLAARVVSTYKDGDHPKLYGSQHIHLQPGITFFACRPPQDRLQLLYPWSKAPTGACNSDDSELMGAVSQLAQADRCVTMLATMVKLFDHAGCL